MPAALSAVQGKMTKPLQFLLISKALVGPDYDTYTASRSFKDADGRNHLHHYFSHHLLG